MVVPEGENYAYFSTCLYSFLVDSRRKQPVDVFLKTYRMDEGVGVTIQRSLRCCDDFLTNSQNCCESPIQPTTFKAFSTSQLPKQDAL